MTSGGLVASLETAINDDTYTFTFDSRFRLARGG